MTDSQPLPVAEEIFECKCCFEKINPVDQFCQKCGFPLKGSDSEQQEFMYRRSFKKSELDFLAKKIESAATTLYVLAGLSFLIGIVYFFINRTTDDGSALLITYTIIAVIYLLLGVWSKTKPLASIISGMVLYVLLEIMGAIDNPLNIFKGIILKVIIISYLIKGLMSALEAEKIRRQHHI
jgi:hypothetical protein